MRGDAGPGEAGRREGGGGGSVAYGGDVFSAELHYKYQREGCRRLRHVARRR